MTKSTRLRSVSGALFALIMMTACGGGGGADTPMAGAPPGPPPVTPAPDTGTVGIILTDAPTEDFAEILATISSIELRGQSGNAMIFVGNETIDLLRLDSFMELFAVTDGVPAGDYNKIRLRLSDLTLVRNDDDGNVVETISVALPGNGKIDLNPRQTFFVLPGSTLLLELDLDAKKSIKITVNGNNETYKFRPVVFIKIHEGDGQGRLARIHGVVSTIDPVAGELVLCQSDFVADSNDEDSDAQDEDRCLTINALDDTGIFGTDGEPADFSMLMVGDSLTAIGNLRVSNEGVSGDGDSAVGDSDSAADSDADSDSDGDSDSDSDANFDDDDLILDAYVIEIGELGTFERLDGTVASDLTGDMLEFALDIAPGQGFGDDSSVSGRLQTGTRIFDRAGTPLDNTALTTGTEGHFEGVLMLSDSSPDVLKTALIVLNLDADTDETISGEIQMINLVERTLTLSTDPGDRCVLVPEDTAITLVTITDDGMTSETIELADLMAGMTAEVFGHEDVGGCFVAQTIRADNDGGMDGNRAPIADAGPNQEVATGDAVTLDGSASSDPDADALTFSWTLTAPAGSAAMLSDSTAVSPTFVADVDGEYLAELVINDGTEDSDPDSALVVASIGSTGNVAPVADAGPDQDLTTGDTVVLDGTNSSDADGDPLTASWTLTAADGSTAALDDPSSLTPSFVADVAGEYRAQLIVNDGNDDSAPDSVTVTATMAMTSDGEALYGANCETCHGTLNDTSVGSQSAENIQTAIADNRGGMGFLSFLTSEEVAAIAAALEGL